MRAVRCAVNFNEILQKVVGLEQMWAESTDTVDEICVFASQKLIRTWLNGDGTDLQTLGITPTKQQLHNNRPRHRRASKPNSFSLHHVGEPTRRQHSRTWKEQQMISL